MKRGKTKSGFEFVVDENVMDDLELIEAVADSQGRNPLAITTVFRKVLGEEQKTRLFDHLRTEDGRVPSQAASEEIMEIIEQLGEEGKNS